MQLTENFELSEFIESQTAKAFGISNEPNSTQVSNILLLCENVLQPLRDMLGRPIEISSGFRSPALNKRVGGVQKSQHWQGLAADFKVPGMTVQEVFEFVAQSDLPYDQLIQEFDAWVHISYRANPRREAFYATRNGAGRPIYKPYNTEK